MPRAGDETPDERTCTLDPGALMPAPLSFPRQVVAPGQVGLRLARDEDAAQISEWTHAPAVNQFWAGRPITVEEVLAKYTGRRLPDVVSYLITEKAVPVGYVQAWQRGDRFGMDMFIAAEAQGRGIGPCAARALALELSSRGWNPLTVDPAADNLQAIRAWKAAGFVPTGEVGMDEGRRTQLLAFRPMSSE